MGSLQLAWRSLLNRRVTALLTIAAVAISVTLLLGVQKMRTAAKDGFANTVSGVDLLVGARTGPANLLLASIFRIGEPQANVSWASYRRIADHRDVAWTIPLSLGDSYRGYRVVGTNADYFAHYAYGGGRRLEFESGVAFADLHDAVLGSEVARALGLARGDSLVISHGVGNVSFENHDDDPFTVSGVLASTGTPVDQAVHISLQALSAIHGAEAAHTETEAGHAGTDADHTDHTVAGHAGDRDLTPTAITAFMVGMRSRPMALTMQRAINDYRAEPLLAIVPGVTLQQLWSIVGIADRALMLIAAFVVVAGLLGMLAAILTSLNERRREMAILRSVGAQPRHIFTLMMSEAGLLAIAGVTSGVALTYALLAVVRPWARRQAGIVLELTGLTRYDVTLLLLIVVAALLIGMFPAWRAYRNTLADGLTLRV